MKRSYIVLIIGAGIIVVGFSSPWIFTDFLLQNEIKKMAENSGVAFITPEKPFFTNITLYGEKNVTADFTSKENIPTHLTLISNDGVPILNTTIEYSESIGANSFHEYAKDFKFYNTKPTGIYQLKASDLGDRPANFTFSIEDSNSCWGQEDFIKCVTYKYYDLVVLVGWLAVIGYVGIGVVGLGGLLFFLDRRQTHV